MGVWNQKMAAEMQSVFWSFEHQRAVRSFFAAARPFPVTGTSGVPRALGSEPV
jgi:hypothetical protein